MRKYSRIEVEVLMSFMFVILLFATLWIHNAQGSNQINDINVPQSVTLDDQKETATITFDLNAIKDAAIIQSIASKKEGLIIYDGEKKRDAVYVVTENGKYSFTVKYKTTQPATDGKPDENVYETNLDVDVSGIQPKEIIGGGSSLNTVPEPMNEEPAPPEPGDESENADSYAALDSTVNLNDAFYIFGNRTYNGQNSIVVSGNTAMLSNQKVAAGYKMQTSSITTKNKISFKNSWEINASYKQAKGPDGVSIAFHNIAKYDGTKSGGGFLGVYAGNGAAGLKKGVVLELDAWGNGSVYSSVPDQGYGSEKAGAHLDVVKVANGVGTRWGSANTFQADTIFDGQAGDLKVSWNADTRELKIAYKGKWRTVTFGSWDSAKTAIGLDENLECYYTISSVINYDYASGDTQFTFKKFNYTDIAPELLETKKYIVDKTSGSEIEVGTDNDLSRVKSGDTVLVRHKLRNTANVPRTVEDMVRGSISLKDYDKKAATLVSGSVKYYTDASNKKSIPDAMFAEGAKVTYPANQGECYIEYQIKIPDYMDEQRLINLVTQQKLGENGMDQKSYTQETEIISRDALSANGNTIENHFYPLDKTGAPLDDTRLAQLFFSDMTTVYRNNDQTSYIPGNIYELLFKNKETTGIENSQTLAVLGRVDQSGYFGFSSYNGTTGNPVNLRQLETNKMGMYYVKGLLYNPNFDKGYGDWNNDYSKGNPNGLRSVVKRVWISENHAQQNGFIGLSNNIELDEVTLSKMTQQDLHNEILKQVKVYLEQASVDANGNISGELNPAEKALSVTNTSFTGISVSSPSKADPYAVTVKATIDGKEISIPIQITVIASEPQFYVVLPKHVELKKDGGINADYVGAKTSVEIVPSLQGLTKEILIKTDSNITLKNAQTTDQYIVRPFDNAGTALGSVDGKSEIGTLSSKTKTKQFWLNAEKEANAKEKYDGAMQFYITFK
ncbi:lectin-like domain-containing protein [Eubacterium sp.]|uniref:lectin-like domain-containing protein n=1 Tax=Eubacterium sp. TaxID=142586 RepID=UPI002FCA421C